MIEVHKHKDGRFYFIAKSTNGSVLAESEKYQSKQGAFSGATSLLRELNSPTRIIDKTNEDKSRTSVRKA